MNGNNNYDDPAMDDGEMMDDAFDDSVAGDEYGEGTYDDEYAGEEYAEGEYEEGAYDEEGGPYEGEEWDESSEAQSGGDDEAAHQKRRARFNMMVIGGGVALGAVFMLFQLMSGGPAPVPALPQSAAVSSGADGQAQEAARRRLASASLHDSSPETQRNVIHGRGRDDIAATVSESARAGGLLNDPEEVRRVDEYRSRLNDEFESMYEEGISFGGRSVARGQAAEEDVSEHEAALTPLPGEEADMLPSPRGLDDQAGGMGLPRAEDLRLAGTPDDAGALVPPQDNGAGLSAPPSPFGAVPPMPESAPLQDVAYGHDPVAQEQAVGLENTAPAVMPPMLEDIAGDQSAAQVAAEREKIAALESELSALNSAISTERSGFESRIRDLEKTIKQLEIALESQAGAAAQRSAVQSAGSNEGARAVPRGQAATAPAPRAATTAPARQAAPVRWVLKAAAPGTAMVSRQGDSEIRNIAIGDTLPGIGRVNQIYQGTNGWVVEGSQGRISQ